MGISTYAVLVVGVTGEELIKNGFDEYFIEHILESGCDFIQPYYDCSYENGIIGIEVSSDDYFEFDYMRFQDKIEEAKNTFKELIDMEPKVFISVNMC